MNILFHVDAWQDYLSFQESNLKIMEKINKLIKDISKTPFSGLGKPEPLKYAFIGSWSRRIDHEHRLVYIVKDNTIHILQCKYHY